jgi:hypothetical protein
MALQNLANNDVTKRMSKKNLSEAEKVFLEGISERVVNQQG